MSEQRVKVRVDDDHLERVPEVADRLRAAGMRVDEQLESLGYVIGAVDSSRLPEVQKVAGVAAGGITPEEEFTVSTDRD
jgi:hypothetical protein